MPALRFDNAFVRDLPADPSTAPGTRQVRGALYSRVMPTAVAAPRLIAHSREVAALLGHAVDTTAIKHYGRKTAGVDLVRVRPAPEDVARVRRVQ